MGRVAPLHPFTGRRIVHETVDSIEELLSQGKVALHQEDIAQVELGVGNHLVVAPLPGLLGPLSVEVEGAVQVPEFDVEPPEAVEEAVAPISLPTFSESTNPSSNLARASS